jgi:RNA polymerase sigma factor (sigma-70 family)
MTHIDKTNPVTILTPRELCMQKITWEQAVELAYPIIVKLAHKHARKLYGVVDVDDLISVGLAGLYESYGRFRNDGRALFTTYVRFRINGAMIDEIRKHSPLSRRDFAKSEANILPIFCELDANVLKDNSSPLTQLLSFEKLEKMKQRLSDRSLMILQQKILEGKTLKEIALIWSMSEARISQLVNESLKLMEEFKEGA